MDRADAAVVLCAGASRRMGRPKGLLALAGAPLLVRHVEALAPYARRAVVVLGAEADAHRRVLSPGVLVVENPDWDRTWPADSLRLALRAVPAAESVWVTPVDVPPARPATLEALLACGAPAVPTDRSGRPGHPVLLDADLAARVRRRAPAGGLRALLTDAPRVLVLDPWIAADFDDPEAWRRYLEAQ